MPVDLTARPSQPKAPPAKRRTAQAQPQAQPVSRQVAREDALNGIGRISALLLCLRGAYADAGAVAHHAPPFFHETAVLAETDDKIASVIDYLTEAGPYMGLVATGLPLVMQILANHGRIDASRLPPESGVIAPDALAARVKADMEKQRFEFLRQAEESRQASEQAARELARVSQNGDSHG